MSRILFSLFSNINWLSGTEIDPFYEGFINTLLKEGNEVMLIRTNEFLPHQHENKLFNHIDSEKLIEDIMLFNPELVIAANNHIPQQILEIVECPIILWTSDSPAWYSDKEYIKKNIQRYKFFHHGWENMHVKVCIEAFNAREDQNYCVGHATGIYAEEKNIKSNITFVGTVGHAHDMMNFLKYNCTNNKLIQLKDFYHKILKNPLDDISAHFDSKLSLSNIHQAITCNKRIKTLDALCDLGLEVYGLPTNFFDAAPYSLDLALCFNYTPVVTLKDSQEIFNSSKIGVNLYSAHAITSFSWRVADVMASNACLVSPYKKEFEKFNPYIKMPTFETPQEARDLCQKLLKDEVWRKEIVTSSHLAIKEHGRFENMFKIIENVINLKLLNSSTPKKLILLRAHNYTKLTYIPLFFVTKKLKSNNFIVKAGLFFFKICLKFIPKSVLSKIYHFVLRNKKNLKI